MLPALLVAAALAPSAPVISYIPPVRGSIIRHFEPPATPYAAGHRGIDIAVPIGTDVVASAGGIVAFAGSVAGEKFVSIDHPDGIRTTYSYLSVVLVKAKAAVVQGGVIGRSGTGHPSSTLPAHLHFGMKRGEVYLDPEPFLLEPLRHDYSGIVRLVPVEKPLAAGRVGAAAIVPPAMFVAAVHRPRRRFRRHASKRRSLEPGAQRPRSACPPIRRRRSARRGRSLT